MKLSWAVTVIAPFLLTSSATGQVYTQTRQSREIQTSVTARVPGQPDAADSDSQASAAPGGFNELVASDATTAVPGSDPMVFAGVNAQALGSFVPGDTSMTGALAAGYRVDSRGGDAGANTNVFFETEFTVPFDTPYRLATQLKVMFDPATDDGNRGVGGGVTLIDLDTEDPHGGPTVVFGHYTSTDAAFDQQLDGSGTFLAGHRYILQAEADAGRELLNNPPPSGARVSSGRSELSFRMDLPEPSAAAAALFVAPALLARRRR